MKRSRMTPRPRDRGTDRAAAHTWFVAVTRGRACVVCNAHRGLQGHHVIEQAVLRREFPLGVTQATDGAWFATTRWDDSDQLPARSLQELLWSPANGIALCSRDHERHTNAVERVPYSRLPAAAVGFALELGLQHRLGPRHYDPS